MRIVEVYRLQTQIAIKADSDPGCCRRNCYGLKFEGQRRGQKIWQVLRLVEIQQQLLQILPFGSY